MNLVRKIAAAGTAGAAVGMAAAAAVSWRTARRHREREKLRHLRDATRAADHVCETRYPILLVHGIAGLDWEVQRFWGRIPAALRRNGALVFAPDHQSTRSVADAGEQVAEMIDQVIAESGAEKVNIIAHSKGGLDSRWAISVLGRAKAVASLTTISTPHHGCAYVAMVLRMYPGPTKTLLKRVYGWFTTRAGVPEPDLLAMARDVTPQACERLNALMPDAPGVVYRSTGSAVLGGIWDGVVPTSSMLWGEWLGLVPAPSRFGIDHSTVIDMAGFDINGFDVTEFYIQLVADLKADGL
ncbi:MAG: alpha/beta fold hydrolase [Promicromonosporaceae bacterium]|nr:alpha/beta fold hydrolase [Promicromonosporaceae bacterium]